MTQSNPGNTELRYNVRLQPFEPDPSSPLREPGELWVNSTNLTMYVFTDDLDSQGTPGWVGVTSGQNVGSIIYSGDTPPTLADRPNLINIILTSLDPRCMVWSDTSSNALKIWFIQPSAPRDLDENGDLLILTMDGKPIVQAGLASLLHTT